VSIRGSTSPLRFLRVFASSRETNSPRLGTATLVTSNLLILAASNVLFPFCAVSTAKLMCSTNTLPLFVDRSSGIWRRLLIMPFNRPVTTEEKINGMDKSDYWLNQGELPGIFMWALSGLRRLQRQGAFSESVVCNDAIAEHRAECNPTADWLLDTYAKSDGGTIEKTQMFKNYFDFFKQSNEKPLTRSAFFKEVRRVFKGVKDQRGERKGTDRRRLMTGISRID
jgi:putative DNA primase/helicase